MPVLCQPNSSLLGGYAHSIMDTDYGKANVTRPRW